MVRLFPTGLVVLIMPKRPPQKVCNVLYNARFQTFAVSTRKILRLSSLEMSKKDTFPDENLFVSVLLLKFFVWTGWNKNLEAFGVGGIDYLDQIMLDYPGPGKLSRHAIKFSPILNLLQ